MCDTSGLNDLTLSIRHSSPADAATISSKMRLFVDHRGSAGLQEPRALSTLSLELAANGQ